jgi:hypothetical protein
MLAHRWAVLLEKRAAAMMVRRKEPATAAKMENLMVLLPADGTVV